MSRTAVEVETADGLVLRGEAIARSDDWAVLVHDLGEDIDAWRPVPDRLAADGLSVLALDLRGHGGSDGELSEAAIGADASTALAHARDLGARRLYAVAAGRSCGPAAREAAGRCRAIVALAPVDELSDWGSLPRLAVVGATSPFHQDVAEQFRGTPGWAIVAHVPFSAPGLGVLQTPWGSNVVEYIGGFLKGQRLLGGRAA